MAHMHGGSSMGDMSMNMSHSMASDDVFCIGEGTVMLNGFDLAADGGYCIKFLFADAVVDTKTKYVFAVLGTFLLAIMVELLRLLRTRIASRDFGFARRLGDSALDAVVVLLFAVQMCVAYWLMLLVMLYEYVIFITIVLGLACGLLVARRLDRRFFPRAAGQPTFAGTPCCDGGECTMTTIKSTAANGSGKGKGNAYYELNDTDTNNVNGSAAGGARCKAGAFHEPATSRSTVDAV